MSNDFKITLAHMFPTLLNLYGDIGNILALKKRCQWRGIGFEIDEIHLNQDLSTHDIYFIGGGQDRQQADVSKELQRHKDFLHKEAESNKVFLGICGGYQFLGHYYEAQSGEKLYGLGILDAYTIAGNKRYIGNVTAELDFLEPKTIVGFENHSGLTFLKGETKPLAKIMIGNGNNDKDNSEGAVFKNVFGTYLHGSFLPKNPHFADYLIELALEQKYGEKIILEKLDDEIELNTHQNLVKKSY